MRKSRRRKKVSLIEGWMGKHSRRWLAERAKDAALIVEVGVWKGRSTKVLADNTRGRVFAVDHWKGTPEDDDQHDRLYGEADDSGDRVFSEFCRNLGPYIEAGKVVPVRMPSVEAAEYLLREYGPVFGFVFIDADHSYEGCKADIEAYRRLVYPGGLLAGHDYHWPGVYQAVNEAFPADRIVAGPKTLWSIKPERMDPAPMEAA